MVELLRDISMVLGGIFTIFYFYQIVYMFVGLLKKPIELKAIKQHRYAVLISARNERKVIGQLIESIKQQNYPSDMINIFVVADNCTDDTVRISRAAGAEVYERFNQELIGKGYALDFLLGKIREDYGREAFDGYFVFDADNILDENYIAEMNKTFGHEYNILTSYRNSKNYGSNWISAGYSLWFLREAKYINNARMILGTSCAVSGTGFLIHKKIINKNNGWIHHLLTEDIEFTVDNVIQGEIIGYCHNAILYDEQPTRFIDSWNQRLRWSKGFYQVFFKYGGKLGKKMITERNFSAYDMFMTVAPGIFLTIGSFILGGMLFVYSLFNPSIQTSVITALKDMLLFSGGMSYMTLFTMGFVTTVTEWRQIHSRAWKKIIYMFTFPLYVFTYIPISIVALFKKIQWVPIRHDIAKSAGEIRSTQ